MVYLDVFFNDVLQGQVELNKALITIGRSDDNDVRIDNPGVSAQHARVICEGDNYFIEDNDSTNGTTVNGEPVSRKQLAFGDKIGVFKHTLRFSAVDLQDKTTRLNNDGRGMTDGAGTVAIDVSRLDELIKKQMPQANVYLQVEEKNGRRRKRPLSKPSFKIGKDPLSDLVVRGWFLPKTIASIERKADGHYLVPGRGGKVRLNGERVTHPVKLQAGDNMLIRYLDIVFVEDD